MCGRSIKKLYLNSLTLSEPSHGWGFYVFVTYGHGSSCRCCRCRWLRAQEFLIAVLLLRLLVLVLLLLLCQAQRARLGPLHSCWPRRGPPGVSLQTQNRRSQWPCRGPYPARHPQRVWPRRTACAFCCHLQRESLLLRVRCPAAPWARPRPRHRVRCRSPGRRRAAPSASRPSGPWASAPCCSAACTSGTPPDSRRARGTAPAGLRRAVSEAAERGV